MQRILSSNCQQDDGAPSGPIRRASGQIPHVSTDPPAGEPTDPFASEGPLLAQSEWPSADELETSLLSADPFEFVDGSKSLSGEIAELFGEIEPQLPRDTLPSPPPSADESAWFDLTRSHPLR